MLKLKKVVSTIGDIFTVLMLVLVLIAGCFGPVGYMLWQIKTLEERAAKYDVVEDITTLNIKGKNIGRGYSSYYVEDTDGLISKLDSTLLQGDWDSYYDFGDNIVVDRRRFYTKDEGVEELRQYKMQTKEKWPDEEYADENTVYD